MALNKTQLKNTIKALLNSLAERTENPIQAREDFAEGLANAIHTYTTSAVIRYTGGLSAGSNTVVGTFNGNLE